MRFLALIPIVVVGILAASWALMLLLGVLHHEISDAIPAIGYGPAVAISAALGLYAATKAAFSGLVEEVLK